eukprot:NODE_89_length_1654_cov_286.080550_g87_i0.p1 GENE.NODE_89_length_1654_cov_286.080550_g87_i0~~NODE_89_length_1654_cov_286.080550_g87_i0.p1  ORF type:complete len:443 (-),score=123.56 NODE_89_length_1654_cov_286.080550_g87_i0:326-1585(-)
MSDPMEEEDGVDYEEEDEEEQDEVPDVVDMGQLESQGLQIVELDDEQQEGPLEEDDDENSENEEQEDDDIMMIEPERCDAIKILKAHTSPVHALAVHPSDSSLLVSGGEDDTAYIWNWHEATVRHTLKGHTDTVISACFCFKGQFVITGGMEGCVKLWDCESGKEVKSLTDLSDGIEWVLSHPEGPIFFAGGTGGQSAMWNTKGDCVRTFWGHGDKVTCGALSGDGRVLITGSADGSVKVFSPTSGEVMHTIEKGTAAGITGEEVTCLATSPQHEKTAIAGYIDGVMVWFDPKTGKVFKVLTDHKASIESISISNSLPLFASGDSQGELCVWDMDRQAMRYRISVGGPIPKTLWMNEKLFYVTATGAAIVRDGRTKEDTDTITFLGHRSVIQNAVVAKDPPCLITCSDDNDIQVYNLVR